MSSSPSQIISQHHWWHTIDLGHQLVTPGAWDIRHLPAHIPWPDSLVGQRCLDVGTMDGFWAFDKKKSCTAENAESAEFAEKEIGISALSAFSAVKKMFISSPTAPAPAPVTT